MGTQNRLFMTLMAALLLAFGPLGQAGAVQPDSHQHVTKQGNFDDVFQDLQDAIINRGYVIDYVGHVDKMLERTSEVAKSVTDNNSKTPYLNARYVQFCSAKLTHESVSANPYNLSICPYVVFIFEAKSEPGKIIVGYRRPVPGPSKRSQQAFAKIDKLMQDIVGEAVQ